MTEILTQISEVIENSAKATLMNSFKVFKRHCFDFTLYIVEQGRRMILKDENLKIWK
jgi:hypothetical protein